MTVGFFMPLPLAVMIPFMAGQSFAMGEAFGKGFQYGKRRISAMTNEQFNAMSASDHFSETTADISAMIPSMKKQMNNFSMLQTDIIKTLIEQLKDAGITIGEAITTAGSETFTEGPPGGTETAQQALDQLRSLVGLPPQYSKLVAPAGLAALIHFWQVSGLLEAYKLVTNPTTWIFNQIKQIFNQNPPQNTVISVFDWINDNAIVPSGGVGPPPPPGGVTPPPNEPITTKDTRHSDIFPPSIRAPSSIITKFNLLNQEIRAWQTRIDGWVATNSPHLDNNIRKAKENQQEIMREMLALWNKYDLEGKVNSSYYNYHTPLATHH